MAWVPRASGTPLPLLALWLVALAAYGIAAGRAASWSPRAIWVGGLVLRAGLLPAVPTLSEDIYRYMWDGWVQLNGVNPFAYPPSAPELAHLRLDWWPLINHPTVPTIYPPGAQIVFVALGTLGPGWLVYKLAWTAADLLAARLLTGLVEDGARRRRALLLYLWSPLLLVEVAWSGHLEPLGVAAMLGALVVARRTGPDAAPAGGPDRGPTRRAARGTGVLLGAGGSIKFAPLAAVPALWRRYGAGAAALALALPALLYLPYVGVGARVFAGLRTYADTWAFNPGLFRLLSLPGGADVARGVAGACVAAIAAWAAVRRWDLERTLYWTIGAALLVSPTVHPWYLLWILPLACVRGGRGWIVFTGSVFLAYAGRDAYLAVGTWPEPAWLRLVIHAPPIALLARDGVRDARVRRATPPSVHGERPTSVPPTPPPAP